MNILKKSLIESRGLYRNGYESVRGQALKAMLYNPTFMGILNLIKIAVNICHTTSVIIIVPYTMMKI
jgi:hypothetical protein